MSTPYTNSRKSIITPGGGKQGTLPTSDISRVLPRQLSTGTTRGTQRVGYGNALIDGSNNRIVVGAPDGTSVGIGAIPGTNPVEYGFFTLAANGSVVTKIVDGSIYIMDGSLVRMIAGILPDDTVNVAISKDGESVTDAFSA